MKTSNKILIGIIVAPLLILTLLHLTLYAKYKAGSFASLRSLEDNRFTRTTYKNIRHIAVYGLGNCRILPADSLHLEIEKNVNAEVHYSVHGDSLIIRGERTVEKSTTGTRNERSYQDVKLFVPLIDGIFINNSEVRVEGSDDSTHAASYVFSVVNSGKLEVNDRDKPVYFKGLTIHASHGEPIELSAQTHIQELGVVVVETDFSDNGASVEKLVINADKDSRITLKGDNLQKLQTVKQP